MPLESVCGSILGFARVSTGGLGFYNWHASATAKIHDGPAGRSCMLWLRQNNAQSANRLVHPALDHVLSEVQHAFFVDLLRHISSGDNLHVLFWSPCRDKWRERAFLLLGQALGLGNSQVRAAYVRRGRL